MPGVTKAYEADNDGAANRQQRGQADTEAPVVPEKELSTRENNVAKIKVVVSCVSLACAIWCNKLSNNESTD